MDHHLVVSAGYSFLGFGGSRWTAPYTERYIGLAVSIGIKLLVLYCVIAAGQSLVAGWNAEASGIGTSTTPAKTALDVIGGALIYMMCCWQIPKLFGAVIGGSPALTGGDLVMAGTAVAGGALAAASLGAGAIAGVAGAGAVGAAGAGSAAVGTSSAANAAGSTGSSVASAISSVGSASAASSNSSAGAASAARASFTPPMSNGSGSGVQSSVNGVGKTSGLDEVGGQPLAGSGLNLSNLLAGSRTLRIHLEACHHPEANPASLLLQTNRVLRTRHTELRPKSLRYEQSYSARSKRRAIAFDRHPTLCEGFGSMTVTHQVHRRACPSIITNS